MVERVEIATTNSIFYFLATTWVGERCVRGEALAEADVDSTQVRMPE